MKTILRVRARFRGIHTPGRAPPIASFSKCAVVVMFQGPGRLVTSPVA